MDNSNDQKYARALLESRDQGWSYWLYLRRERKKLLIQFLVFGLSLLVMISFEYRALAYFLGGMLSGSILRDLGWVRSTIKSWPFIVRVLNWGEVLRHADDKRAA